MLPTILISNDDGVEAQGLKELITALHQAGWPLLVCAPDRERSASSMMLTLHQGLTVTRRDDIVKSLALNGDGPAIEIYSTSGSPSDSVLIALSGEIGSGVLPAICISGANRGPNLSIDILHSGTVGAARQASLAGIPSLAVSLNSYSSDDYSSTVSATIEVLNQIAPLVDSVPRNFARPKGSKTSTEFSSPSLGLREAWKNGDIYLNLNVPVEWNGEFCSTRLGARWYRGAVSSISSDGSSDDVEIGSTSIVDDEIEMGDSNVLLDGFASLSTMPTWPQGHPLAIPDAALATTWGVDGFPEWLAN